MSQTRRLASHERTPSSSAGDPRLAQSAIDHAELSGDSAAAVDVLDQLQVELAEFIAETRRRLQQVDGMTGRSSASPPPAGNAAEASVALSQSEPTGRKRADESLDRLQEIKRRLAAQLQ